MPAAALANAYDDTLKEYRTTGAINGCGYTAAQLAEAKAQTPKNVKDVAPGYPAQLAVAAAKRAKGCTKAEETAAKTTAAAGATTATTGTGTTARGTTGAGAATQPPATTTIAPNATTAATPAPAAAPATTTAPAPATQSTASHKGARLALIVIGALLVMLLALWAFARWWAWEPHWLARWRHATAEAGWRASAAWAEFTDWLRLGR
jgi:hypothetical protein